MGKIIAIMGLSGVGKTTIARRLSETLELPFVISWTTRPIRSGEVDGIDYHFVNDIDYDFMDKHSGFVCKQEFKVANGDIWRYAIDIDDIEDDCIIISTPRGIKSLRESGYNVKTIFLKVNEDERIERIINRNDNQSIDEIARRSIADKKAFESFVSDIVVDNNNNINVTIETILELLER